MVKVERKEVMEPCNFFKGHGAGSFPGPKDPWGKPGIQARRDAAGGISSFGLWIASFAGRTEEQSGGSICRWTPGVTRR